MGREGPTFFIYKSLAWGYSGHAANLMVYLSEKRAIVKTDLTHRNIYFYRQRGSDRDLAIDSRTSCVRREESEPVGLPKGMEEV
jgi:hypothetical protein